VGGARIQNDVEWGSVTSHKARQHTVLLVEDDDHTRGRLAAVVDGHPRLRLLAAVGSVAEARAALARTLPDVLLTDIGLPDGTGIDLVRDLRERQAPTLSMVITVFGDEQHVVAAIEAGALGYLLKDGSPDSIGTAILELLEGGSPISAPIARYLLKRFRPAATDVRQPGEAGNLPRLSEREREVLTLIVKGFSYAEAARLMGISPHTVTAHVRSIYGKLEVHSRGEAVYEALQLGLVKLDD
jgi:DNA-binding NarL/FixJ family response regulator